MGNTDIRLVLKGVLILLGRPCGVSPDKRLTGVLLTTLPAGVQDCSRCVLEIFGVTLSGDSPTENWGTLNGFVVVDTASVLQPREESCRFMLIVLFN